ncbi:adenosine kinase-like isoform X2 [Bolinopsis microptera]|uniref:adenosine kinase-like isoform X2 n=1 Tax=Bolinopsis microptera TaxID=2820187 RepID=UPI00307A176D
MIFGLVHPLLDITAIVDQEYLDRYGLKENDGILAQEKHKEIYAELLNGCRYKVKKIPGGATQNALRIAQWYLKKKHATTIVGCIGGDKVGEDMREQLEREGCRTEYMVDPEATTGLCAVLISSGSNSRSLVTRLDAANLYKHSHLVSDSVWRCLEESSFFYMSGFMLNFSSDTMVVIGEHAVEKNKCFMLNLSAPYLSSLFKKVLPYCDIIVGNSDEAATLAKNFEFNTTELHDMIRMLADMPKVNEKRKRIVLITQQEDPVLVYSEGKTTEYPVLPISPEDIVDTNGAGDGFVGGFLASYALNKPLEDCVRNGIVAAHMIIQVCGCTLPIRD